MAYKTPILLAVLCMLPYFASGQITDSLAYYLNQLPPDAKVLRINTSAESFLKGKYSLRDYLYLLPDPGGDFDLTDVAAPDKEDQFRPLSECLPLPVEQQVYWMRLSIRADLDQSEDWLVNFMLSEVEAYVFSTEQGIQIRKSGVLVPSSERYFGKRYGNLPLLPISLPQRGTVNFYWRIKSHAVKAISDYGIALNFNLLSPAYVADYRQVESFILALSLGFWIAVGLYHLVIFFYIREVNYLWFSLYCLIGAISWMIMTGYAMRLFWPDSPHWHYDFGRPIGIVAISFCLMGFTRSYLKTTRWAPFWDRVILLLWASLVIASAGSALFSDPAIRRWSMGMFIRLQMLLPVAILFAALQCLRSGYRPAKFFLLASISYLAGMFLNVLEGLEIIPHLGYLNWSRAAYQCI